MFTVDNLVTQVRDQIQEANTDTVGDDVILRALNRGNSYAWDIYVRHYPEPLITRKAVTLNSGGTSFNIPEDTFEQRLQKVEATIGGVTYEIDRLNYRKTTPFRNNIIGNRPRHYSITGRLVELFPSPSGNSFVSYSCHYIRRPDELITQQGRITASTASVTGVSDASIVVDVIGSRLSTSDPYLQYVNFVNGRTGEIRGSAQIKTLSGTQITFFQSPTRSTVEGRTISGDIPSDLEADDYITDINGTCVIFLQQPTTNFLIQYAVAEIRRALGYDTGVEANVLKDFEKQVKRTWAGREASMQITSSNRVWRR